MRVFITGATGWIGSAVVPELLAHGHQVIGLARSDTKAETLEKSGAEVLRGDLDTLDVLREGARNADAVIHLAFVHDFSNFADSLTKDRAAIDAIGDALAGTDRPFAIASGTLGLLPGRVATETDRPDPATAHPRQQSAAATLALEDRGVRSIVVRLAPTVHGEGDGGFVPFLISVARDSKVAGYVGDGSNRWTAVHVKDAATLFRLAIEQAPAGSVLHAVGEEAVTGREIAEAIGRGLGVPVAPRRPEEFSWIGPMFAMDSPASNKITRELLGWTPVGPTLITDLDAGHYFK